MLIIFLGATAGALALFQYFPYISDTLKGKTKPHAFSWFIWGVPAGVAYFAQVIEGGGAGSWVTGITAIICIGIFFFSLRYGERTLTRLDWACLLLSLIAVTLWGATNDPFLAVLLVTIADLIAFGPTIRKSLAKPYEETLSTYAISGVKWSFGIAALATFNPTTLLYPLAMVLANAGFALFLARRRKVNSAV